MQQQKQQHNSKNNPNSSIGKLRAVVSNTTSQPLHMIQVDSAQADIQIADKAAQANRPTVICLVDRHARMILKMSVTRSARPRFNRLIEQFIAEIKDHAVPPGIIPDSGAHKN